LNQVLPKIESTASSQNYGRFSIGPLESGYGITLGNALRRVLLSSLQGAAVTSIRVSGVHHEFQDIPYVKEDTTALILNVKQLRLKSHSEEPARLHIEVRGEGIVTAGDLYCPPDVDIINPELHLLTVDSPEADFDMELVVQQGKGYSPAEERGKLPLGEIPVDAIYSPIRKASYTVERARLGQDTGYDRLILEIETDGTMAPEDALAQSAKLLIRHLTLISGVDEVISESGTGSEEGIPTRVFDAPIEDLELTVRAYNCLKRAGITRVGEILQKLEMGEEEILSIRNFGRKSLDELVDKLRDKNYLEFIHYVPGEHTEGAESEPEEEEAVVE